MARGLLASYRTREAGARGTYSMGQLAAVVAVTEAWLVAAAVVGVAVWLCVA